MLLRFIKTICIFASSFDITKEGEPQAAMGALPKHTFEKAIKDVLLKN